MPCYSCFIRKGTRAVFGDSGLQAAFEAWSSAAVDDTGLDISRI
jgi:hypothetical protein